MREITMGFYHNKKQITLENYQEEFKGYSADIKDQIRLAVLDDTEISVYIEKCKRDSYKLGQLRLCLRECVPLEYINSNFTGKTLFNIRQACGIGIPVEPLVKYVGVTATRVESQALELLSDYLLAGVDISSVDFTEIPTHLIPTICKGIKRGLPMYLFEGVDGGLSDEHISVLLKALQLGIDITPFLSNKWDTSCISKVVYLRDKERVLYLLSLINEKFTGSMLDTLIDLLISGVKLDKLCVKDTSGNPVYNAYQMYELGEALKEGSITEQMFNPTLSDYDMKTMRERKKKGISGKLNLKLSKKL